jgi:hypothetical protein
MNPDVVSHNLPTDVLKRIFSFYYGLQHYSASRIQLWISKRLCWHNWVCDDCFSQRLKSNLVKASACDDNYGCCFKKVCKDVCRFYCEQKHLNRDKCPLCFDDSCTYEQWEACTSFEHARHQLFRSRIEQCSTCGLTLYINRIFTFDIWDRHHQIYETLQIQDQAE